jgi:predicted DNA-binding transcriptional regulator AlpA
VSVNNILDEPLWSEDEAATVLKVKPTTMTAWRNRGKGPAYVKVGRLIGYRASDIRAWLNSRIVRPER